MNKSDYRKKIEELGDTNPQEVLRLRGCLINLIKEEISVSSDKAHKDLLRIELVSELKNHKEHIKKMKENENVKTYSLPKKVGLKVKEIATAIELFKEKNDVINKGKKVALNTGVSSVLVAGIASAFAAVGGTLSLATLAGIVPSLCYICLSNILKEGIRESEFTKILNTFENKDEIFTQARQFALDNIVNNKEFTDLLLKKKDASDLNDLIVINEKLIVVYKNIREKAPNEEIKQALTAELVALIKELKSNFEKKKKLYIKNKIELTNQEFALLEKEILNISIDLFKEENYLGDATKNALSNIKINTVTMFVSKLLLSGIFPSLVFDSVKDIITPLFHIVINNITTLGDFKDTIKIKDTKYTEKQIKFNDPELFKKLSESKQYALV